MLLFGVALSVTSGQFAPWNPSWPYASNQARSAHAADDDPKMLSLDQRFASQKRIPNAADGPPVSSLYDVPDRGFAEQQRGLPVNNGGSGMPVSSDGSTAKVDEPSSREKNAQLWTAHAEREELARDIAAMAANMTVSEPLPSTAMSADAQGGVSPDDNQVHPAGPPSISNRFPAQVPPDIHDRNENTKVSEEKHKEPVASRPRIEQKASSSRPMPGTDMITNLDTGAVLGTKRAHSGPSKLDADDIAFGGKKSTEVPFDSGYSLRIPYVLADDDRVNAREISFRAMVTSDVCFAVQSQCTLPLNCTTKNFRPSMSMATFRVPRPQTTAGDNPPETFICASNQTKPIAALSYFRGLKPANPTKVTRICVRTFLNPGYDEEISFRCANCSKYHVLAIRMIPLNCLATIPEDSEMNSGNLRGSYSASNQDCSQVDPCQYDHWANGTATFDTFSDPILSLNDSRIAYHLKNPNRVGPVKRRKWFHHHAALCMYENYGVVSGDFVGFLDIHMDGADVQAFVCFVCFFGVALPLLCMMTLLLHANKQRRCKMRVQVVRLRHQRIQLEEELLTHNGDDDRDDDDHDDRENDDQDEEAPE